MEGSMNRQADDIGRGGIALSKLFMRVMFRHVHGWKSAIPDRTTGFVEVGRDGSRLEGALRPSDLEPARGVVMLCHPFLKYGMHYFFENRIDMELAAAGYHVVAFNFKGFGNSTIRGHAFASDVLSIADRIAREYPGLPIHLLGCSFGGYHLAHALARESGAFASAVLDSVPVSVRSYFTRGPLKLGMHWISGGRLSGPTGTCAIDGSLGRAGSLPIAYLHGTQDRFLPGPAVEALGRVSPRIEFFAFDDCAHLEAHKKDRQRYFQTVLAFIAKAETSSRTIAAPAADRGQRTPLPLLQA